MTQIKRNTDEYVNNIRLPLVARNNTCDDKIEKKSKTNIIQQNEKFTLYIPVNVENKIRYLCSNFPNKEWSGIIFYKYDGSLNDVLNLKLELIDILPLDLGSSVFTLYNFSDEYNEYMMNHIDYMSNDIKQGHIHSHHSMKTDFSGTDIDNLQENTYHYAGFLSLIVNNAGSYTAKLAVEYEFSHTSYKDIDYQQKTKDFNFKVIYMYDAVINHSISSVEDEFIQLTEKIKVSKNLNERDFSQQVKVTEKNYDSKGLFNDNELFPVNEVIRIKYNNNLEKEYLDFFIKSIVMSPLYKVNSNDFEKEMDLLIDYIIDSLDEEDINDITEYISYILDTSITDVDELKCMCLWIIRNIDQYKLKKQRNIPFIVHNFLDEMKTFLKTI